MKHKATIEEYRVYQGKLNQIYVEFERSGGNKKVKLLRGIRSLYIDAKGEVLREDLSQKSIRKNSDLLVDTVKQKLLLAIQKSKNNDLKMTNEDLDFAISIIIVDAFMRCKILEEPI